MGEAVQAGGGPWPGTRGVRPERGRPRLDGVAFDGDRATGKCYFRAVTKDRPPVKELKEELSFVRQAQGDWRVVGGWMLDFVGVPWPFELKQ